MLRQLRKFKEEDFYVLGGPFRAGRQSPGNLAGTLLLSIFIICVLAVLANFFVFVDWELPRYKVVLPMIIIYDSLILLTIILCIVYSIEAVYRTRQASQYFLVIWVSQLIFGQSLFLIVMYMILETGPEEQSMKIALFVIASYIIGILLYVIFFQRMVYKMKKGRYKEGTELDEKRQEQEEGLKTGEVQSYAISFVITVAGAIMSFLSWIDIQDTDMLMLFIVSVALFFTMFLILPTQIMTWYCIRRFKSFQFNPDKEEDQT